MQTLVGHSVRHLVSEVFETPICRLRYIPSVGASIGANNWVVKPPGREPRVPNWAVRRTYRSEAEPPT